MPSHGEMAAFWGLIMPDQALFFKQAASKTLRVSETLKVFFHYRYHV